MVLIFGSAAMPSVTYPGPSNTGYAPGTTFDNAHTVGTGTGQQSSGPGWVIQGTGSAAFVKVSGQSGGALTSLQGLYVPMNIAVRANNVLIQNCLITPPVGKNGVDVINISGDVAHQPVVPSTNVTIDHNTITSQSPVSSGPVPFTATAASPCVFTAPGYSPTAGDQIILLSSPPSSVTLPTGFGDLTSHGFTATVAGGPFGSGSLFTASGTNLIVGQPVAIQAVSGQSLPGGVTAGTWYVVTIGGAGQFQISATSGGAPITVSSAGSGNIGPSWYVVATVAGNSFTLAWNTAPAAPLASGATGTGNLHRMNTAWTGSCGIKDDNGATLGLAVTSNDISNMTSCIQVEQGLVQGNYGHDMNYTSPPGPGASHVNGFSCGGNTSSWETPDQQVLTIRGNTFLNSWTQSDALALFQDSAQQSHKVVDGNLLAGAGYTMGCGFGGAMASPQPTPTDIVIKNNRFSTMYYALSGIFGPADGWTAAMTADPSNIWSNNAYYESGVSIPHP